MIDAASSLIDVAFEVSTALAGANELAVLTGGSAAAYYAPRAYQSLDLDFVLRFGHAPRTIRSVMEARGFTVRAGMFVHHSNPLTVEFPPGPLAIGRDLIETWNTVHRNGEILHLLSVTDCARDRFLHYYAWRDRSALAAAVAVADAHSNEFDRDAFEQWARHEHAENSAYDLARIDEFFRLLQHERGQP